MPRKKVTTTVIEDPDSDNGMSGLVNQDIEPAIIHEETQEAKDIRTFCTNFGADGGSAMVYHQLPNGHTAYCGQFALDNLSEEIIQENFGAGKFIIRLKTENGKFAKTKTVWIDSKKLSTPLVQPVLPGALPDSNSHIDLLRAELATYRDMMMRMIERMGDSQNVRSSGPTSTFAEIAAAMQTLKGVVQEPQINPAGMISSFAEILKQGIEIGSRAVKGEGNSEGIMSTVKDILQNAGGIISSLRKPEAAVQIPQAQNEFQPALPATGLWGFNPQVITGLRQGIAYLKTKAALGKDPGLWVDVIVENLEDKHWASLCQVVEKPIEELKDLDPELLNLPYRPWFEKLFEGVRHAISERIDSAGTSDASDAPGDGSADARGNK